MPGTRQETVSSPPLSPADLSVTLEHLPGSRVTLRVEAPPPVFDSAVDAALRRIARRVRLPGFRPGRAPATMVERAVGWEAVRAEAVDALLPELYGAALERERVRPVDEPELSLDPVARGQTLTFTATVTVRPAIDLGDYRSLRVEAATTEVTEHQVDEMIEEARRRHAEVKEVDRPAQLGDSLRCTLVMRHGEELLSGDEANDRDLVLDADRLLPGLAEGLVGMEAGQQRRFAITLPEDFAREELRGQAVDVEATVSAVRDRLLPDADDSLARLDGRAETLEELRKSYRDRLQEVAVQADREAFEAAALQQLRDRVTVDLPEAMVEREVRRQIGELERRLEQMGMALGTYLEYTGGSIQTLRSERRENAVERLRLELALEALAEAEGIEVDEAQVLREEERVAGRQKLNPEQRRRLHQAAHADLLRRAAADRLLEIARGDV